MTQDTIFISHSSLDLDFSKRLARDLKTHGMNPWLDSFDIPPDSDWNTCIQEALIRSAYCVVIWSKNSVASPEVLAEVFQAKAEGKQIIQVSIEDCKRPTQFERIQNIDFRPGYDEAFATLLSFLPIARRKQRLRELKKLIPDNRFPEIPRLEE
jgi:TIR domain